MSKGRIGNMKLIRPPHGGYLFIGHVGVGGPWLLGLWVPQMEVFVCVVCLVFSVNLRLMNIITNDPATGPGWDKWPCPRISVKISRER